MDKRFLAFTLIELLVVIAIIGILSGLIVVTMSGVNQKATVAKSQVFSNSLRSSLMANLISDWNFDGSGLSDGVSVNSSYLLDIWGQKNGSVTASPPTVLSGSNCISGSCLSFNGSTQYVSIPYNPVFNFGSQMTAMVWVKGGAQNAKCFFSQWDTGQLSWFIGAYNVSPYNQVRVILSSDGNDSKYHVTNSAFLDGNWHLIGFTWNAGSVSVYIDGQAVPYTASGATITSSLWPSTASLNVGTYLNGGSPANYFTGQIDEIRLYSSAIPTSRIKEQYYAGLNKLLGSGGISKEEYRQRITGFQNKTASR